MTSFFEYDPDDAALERLLKRMPLKAYDLTEVAKMRDDLSEKTTAREESLDETAKAYSAAIEALRNHNPSSELHSQLADKLSDEIQQWIYSREEPKLSSDDKMVFVGGSKTAFRCECGCNVFREVLGRKHQTYQCNACGAWYEDDYGKP